MGWHWGRLLIYRSSCVLPYTAFLGLCETNLLCNKTDTKSEVSTWATPWKQTLLIYSTAFLVWDVELLCGEGAHRAPLLTSAKEMEFLGRKDGSCGTRCPHQAPVQEEILVSKCPHSQGSGCWGDPWDGAALAQQFWKPWAFPFPKWSCYGILWWLSHCHGLDLSLTHFSFGFSERGQTSFSPKMCRSSWIEWEGRRINLKYISTIF